METRHAWDVDRKLGLHSKCLDEEMRSYLEILERRDRDASKKLKKKADKDGSIVV